MSKDIEGAKIFLDRYLDYARSYPSGNPFTEYSKTYFWTNENINGYLDLVSFEEKESALSVCSGGDHAFNLIERGILNVDTFDINRLTEYFAFGLKRAMILKYTYEEFIQTSKLLSLFAIGVNFTFEKETEIIISLLPYMDSKYRKFWKEIIDYNYKLQKDRVSKVSLFRILTYNFLAFNQNYNSFLDNEDAYNTLKENLSNANITFKYSDALDLPKRFKGRKYDAILLSNIPDYFCYAWGFDWEYARLRKYEEELEGLVKENGVIFLEYIFGTFDDAIYNAHVLIDDSNVRIDDTHDEELYGIEHHQKRDGMILKRVKK